jgi:hypothetical protein
MWYIISVIILGFLIFKFIYLSEEKVGFVDLESHIIGTVIGAVFWPIWICILILYLLYKLLLDKIYTKFITWLLDKYFKK